MKWHTAKQVCVYLTQNGRKSVWHKYIWPKADSIRSDQIKLGQSPFPGNKNITAKEFTTSVGRPTQHVEVGLRPIVIRARPNEATTL